ncbi:MULTISPECIES: homoserine kinase [Cyanophyceae]|uniref:homoserine kinase n=1 Tax=Cyanophyceae TaxID=3028117 RepID=UPI00232D2126|nr:MULTISPECIES: homoserine kinase [Cyanophyceae]MDB9357259.1 homoserine kinase [Nodularia spumigena CS-587/03]MDB9340884.1 homoserine kinase [Nodularia spumigena CS-589/07]MDB9399989.1 homoserine kinase [Microcystis aeruginosa CS-567/02-A1]MDB9498246.1 homoserine kinase [Nodularia spumigena CS-336/02]MDB9531173.1 homoserine kinase [Nodularia spumigena CS-1038]
MSVISSITVTVPATTANLGPGFDCIGAALTLYNKFKFTRLDEGGLIIAVTGAEAERVQTDESNLLYQAFVKLYQYIGQTPPSVKMEIQLGVPLARGLGSSATAIVGGLVGANQLAGAPLTQLQVMELAIAMEGHPDNVVPALLGGCRLAATSADNWEICDIPWNENIVPVLAIPDFELSTSEARQVLPTQVSRADAIFNTAHLGLLLRGLQTGKGEWLSTALQDRLHQPYRQALIPGYDAVNTAAMKAGAYGMVISGAGPTLLALVDQLHSQAVESAMLSAWQETGITATVRSLSLDTQGASYQG